MSEAQYCGFPIDISSNQNTSIIYLAILVTFRLSLSKNKWFLLNSEAKSLLPWLVLTSIILS